MSELDFDYEYLNQDDINNLSKYSLEDLYKIAARKRNHIKQINKMRDQDREFIKAINVIAANRIK